MERISEGVYWRKSKSPKDAVLVKPAPTILKEK